MLWVSLSYFLCLFAAHSCCKFSTSPVPAYVAIRVRVWLQGYFATENFGSFWGQLVALRFSHIVWVLEITMYGFWTHGTKKCIKKFGCAVHLCIFLVYRFLRILHIILCIDFHILCDFLRETMYEFLNLWYLKQHLKIRVYTCVSELFSKHIFYLVCVQCIYQLK